MYVVSSGQMRKIDDRAIKDLGIPGIVLMENAAIKTVDIMDKQYCPLKERRVLVLAEGGNNGGDGIAIARHLFMRNIDVELCIICKEGPNSGDAGINLRIVTKLGLKLLRIADEKDFPILESVLERANLLVDALFGTGLSRNIEGIYRRVIEMINRSGLPVVSVDIPSGINGDNGHIMGIAVKACDTVTFGYPKRGHLLYPGREYTGRLHIVPISLPPDSAAAVGVRAFTLDDGELAGLLKVRPPQGHKGTFGKVAVIAGSTGMTGAAFLTAMAALKAGAGMVTLGIPKSLNAIMEGKLTEVITVPLEDDGRGQLVEACIDQVYELLEDKDALAIGPGLGKNPAIFQIMRNIFGRINIPIIVDADGLNHISKDMRIVENHTNTVVFTPHPGEMSRLVKKPIQEIMDSPVELAEELAVRLGVVVLLKGACSIVASHDGRTYFNRSGNSGMGTAGTGDVLTGLVASFVAQGYDGFEAAVYGAYIHGRAGDYAMKRLGNPGMTAGDVLDALPLILRDLYERGSSI